MYSTNDPSIISRWQAFERLLFTLPSTEPGFGPSDRGHRIHRCHTASRLHALPLPNTEDRTLVVGRLDVHSRHGTPARPDGPVLPCSRWFAGLCDGVCWECHRHYRAWHRHAFLEYRCRQRNGALEGRLPTSLPRTDTYTATVHTHISHLHPHDNGVKLGQLTVR